MRSAVFLDRDGTIIEDTHYIKSVDDVRLVPGAAQALRQIHEKGYLIFVVSNQAGVAKGLISDAEFMGVHSRVCDLLQKESVEIDEFLYCLHHPDDRCQCRKPRAGLLPKTFKGEPISFSNSFTVGDKEIDVLLADNVGATGCLVLTGKGKAEQKRMGENTVARSRSYEDLLAFANELPVCDNG